MVKKEIMCVDLGEDFIDDSTEEAHQWYKWCQWYFKKTGVRTKYPYYALREHVLFPSFRAIADWIYEPIGNVEDLAAKIDELWEPFEDIPEPP